MTNKQAGLLERLAARRMEADIGLCLGEPVKVGERAGALVNPDGPEAAEAISSLLRALERISNMTDIEADFGGFEAREIARAALSGEKL